MVAPSSSTSALLYRLAFYGLIYSSADNCGYLLVLINTAQSTYVGVMARMRIIKDREAATKGALYNATKGLINSGYGYMGYKGSLGRHV